MTDTVQKLSSTTLDLPPSCIEFSQSCPDHFVVGTYNLEREDGPHESDEEEDLNDSEVTENVSTKTQSRNGSLILFRVDDSGSELTLVHTVTYPSAILDLHFSPHSPNIFAVASSTGSISLYQLQEDPRHALIHLSTHQLFPTGTLVLSLAWHPTFPDLLGATLSTSSVALLQLNSDRTAVSVLRDDLNPHSGLEAWTLTFSAQSKKGGLNPRSAPQGIYSGGDDSKLRCSIFPSISSLRHSARDLALASPGGARGIGGHEAGVTAILPLPLDLEVGQEILLTGSYDDFVRVFATRDCRPGAPNTLPKALAELKIGGGVWRLKFLQNYSLRSAVASDENIQSFRVLASCMHAGARVLEVRGSRTGEWTIEMLGKFEEHASMNYGSDVRPAAAGEGMNDEKALCVSTSFYDKLLCVWRFEHAAE